MSCLINKLTTLEVGASPPGSRRQFAFRILFHQFNTITAESIYSPEFEYGGRMWRLQIYPHGDADAANNNRISIHLEYSPGGSCEALFDNVCVKVHGLSKIYDSVQGWSDIVHKSNWKRNGSYDTLTVDVIFEEENFFVPKNTFNDAMRGLLFDRDSADVCFEVSSGAIEMEPTMIFAHRIILKKCAPMLAVLFNSVVTSSGQEMATVVISDVKPEVFKLLLTYVYGSSISVDDTVTHARDIIQITDKYSIVNLKLKTEAAYVKFTTITMENAIDNLLYADAMNLALLKEAVMNFLALNQIDAIKQVSFSDVPGYLMKDLLVSISRKSNGRDDRDDYDVMSVSELRVKLFDLGLDMDGSREAMITALKEMM